MFLVDDEAVDVSRMTGLPWSYERVSQHGVPQPFLDLRMLDWWQRFRVAWCLIGGYFLVNNAPTN